MSKKLIGPGLDQVPTNAELGTMAYQDSDALNVGRVKCDTLETKFYKDFYYEFTVRSGTEAENHTILFTCPSYFQSEVTILGNQTNGGADCNRLIRGIWRNNYTSHHWTPMDDIGAVGGLGITVTGGYDPNGPSGGTNTTGGSLQIETAYAGYGLSVEPLRVMIRVYYHNGYYAGGGDNITSVSYSYT